ncbi:SMC-Scp complex subunit ScpB, partial [Pseudomonas sp. MPR-R2A5]
MQEGEAAMASLAEVRVEEAEPMENESQARPE